MLTYLIDAFNVIHKIGSMIDSPTVHNDLVAYIRNNRLTGSPTNQVVIVFDGYESPSVMPEHEYNLVFSNNQDADDVIRSKVIAAKNKSVLVVVSDDHGVADFAGAEGARAMHVEEFLRKRPGHRATKNLPEEKELEDSSVRAINKDLMERWVKSK
ncbi:MAG: NYN domain-containing protein [Pseudomonadota bacterium]